MKIGELLGICKIHCCAAKDADLEITYPAHMRKSS